MIMIGINNWSYIVARHPTPDTRWAAGAEGESEVTQLNSEKISCNRNECVSIWLHTLRLTWNGVTCIYRYRWQFDAQYMYVCAMETTIYKSVFKVAVRAVRPVAFTTCRSTWGIREGFCRSNCSTFHISLLIVALNNSRMNRWVEH